MNTGDSNNYKNGIYNLEFYIGYDIALISNIITNEKSKSTAHIDRHFDVSKIGRDSTLYAQRSRKMMVLIQFGLVTLDWCVQKIKKYTLYINIIAWACVLLTAPAPMSVVFLDNIAFSKASNAKTIFFLQLWLNLN